MKISVMIPHYKNGKATAYAVSQLLKYKGSHEVKIIVIDNSFPHESYKYLDPFPEVFIYSGVDQDKISSHGIAFDDVLSNTNLVDSDWFLTAESDSFPTKDWIGYYEYFTNRGIDMAGSELKLSGGTYIHPCAALYSKRLWQEAKEYCDNIEYDYFPNMSRSNLFDCHLMVHKSIRETFLESPEDYIELADGYRPYSKEKAEYKRLHYSSVVNPFHNGMGNTNESLHTYGYRTIESEIPNVILNNKKKLINMIGQEPGQWISYYAAATGKSIYRIPTETHWLVGREGQQQEYTINEAGFKHIWAGSSYLDMKGTEMNDVYEFKKIQIEELYNTLPDHQKIKEI